MNPQDNPPPEMPALPTKPPAATPPSLGPSLLLLLAPALVSTILGTLGNKLGILVLPAFGIVLVLGSIYAGLRAGKALGARFAKTSAPSPGLLALLITVCMIGSFCACFAGCAIGVAAGA